MILRISGTTVERFDERASGFVPRISDPTEGSAATYPRHGGYLLLVAADDADRRRISRVQWFATHREALAARRGYRRGAARVEPFDEQSSAPWYLTVVLFPQESPRRVSARLTLQESRQTASSLVRSRPEMQDIAIYRVHKGVIERVADLAEGFVPRLTDPPEGSASRRHPEVRWYAIVWRVLDEWAGAGENCRRTITYTIEGLHVFPDAKTARRRAKALERRSPLCSVRVTLHRRLGHWPHVFVRLFSGTEPTIESAGWKIADARQHAVTQMNARNASAHDYALFGVARTGGPDGWETERLGDQAGGFPARITDVERGSPARRRQSGADAWVVIAERAGKIVGVQGVFWAVADADAAKERMTTRGARAWVYGKSIGTTRRFYLPIGPRTEYPPVWAGDPREDLRDAREQARMSRILAPERPMAIYLFDGPRATRVDDGSTGFGPRISDDKVTS